jgi:hypothetical protein
VFQITLFLSAFIFRSPLHLSIRISTELEREAVNEGCIKVHNEEFHVLCFCIVAVVKSGEIRQARH